MMKGVTILTSDELRRIEVEVESIIEEAKDGLYNGKDPCESLDAIKCYADRIKFYLNECD